MPSPDCWLRKWTCLVSQLHTFLRMLLMTDIGHKGLRTSGAKLASSWQRGRLDHSLSFSLTAMDILVRFVPVQ